MSQSVYISEENSITDKNTWCNRVRGISRSDITFFGISIRCSFFLLLGIRYLLDFWSFSFLFSLGSSDGIVVGFSEVFVLHLFLNVWCMWPFTICSDLGRYLLTRSNVSPGKVSKKFCFIASIHVKIGGTKHSWWRKIARFCFDDHSYAEFAENFPIIGYGFIFFLSFPLYPT